MTSTSEGRSIDLLHATIRAIDNRQRTQNFRITNDEPVEWCARKVSVVKVSLGDFIFSTRTTKRDGTMRKIA